jgi:hypothetical protein
VSRAELRSRPTHPHSQTLQHNPLGHHRYKWLYVTAFVQPASGETIWYLSNGTDKRFFERLLAAFARQAGAGWT